MKEKYLEYAKKSFKGKALKLVNEQIELVFSDKTIDIKKKYKKNDEVILKKGTFIHGIGSDLSKFDWTIDNGFIATEFNGNIKPKKYFNNVGFWKIKRDIKLLEYIKLCSGITIEYTLDRGTNNKMSELIGIENVQERIEYANNNKNIWSWRAEQTKEIRFIPTLASNKNQIAFILNMESEYAKKLVQNDVFNIKDKKILKYFVYKKCIDSFIHEKPNAFTTDRESAIMFGLPSYLIEGVLLGRDYEGNKEIIEHIREKLPDKYICNLDGKVI